MESCSTAIIMIIYLVQCTLGMPISMFWRNSFQPVIAHSTFLARSSNNWSPCTCRYCGNNFSLVFPFESWHILSLVIFLKFLPFLLPHLDCEIPFLLSTGTPTPRLPRPPSPPKKKKKTIVYLLQYSS